MIRISTWAICILLCIGCSYERSGTETGNPVAPPLYDKSPSFEQSEQIETNINDTVQLTIPLDSADSLEYVWALDGINYEDTTSLTSISATFPDSGLNTV
ncbi:MAG: hypothetical protein ACLFQB_14555 [Chitinispirillaceae bacterium]